MRWSRLAQPVLEGSLLPINGPSRARKPEFPTVSVHGDEGSASADFFRRDGT